MEDKVTPETLLGNLVETISDNISQQKSGSLLGDDTRQAVESKVNQLVGRKKPVHCLLGGGKSADVLLWRNKKISSSVLGTATAVWLLFEWLNYNFLTILSFILVLGMGVQFALSRASGFLGRASSDIPRVELPESLFVSIATEIGSLLNKALNFLQDTACSGNLKQFLLIVASLWAAAVIGSWCNFLTVIYIGFIAAHTLPVLYEKNQEQVDSFIDNLVGQLMNRYNNIDTRSLAKRFRAKKQE